MRIKRAGRSYIYKLQIKKGLIDTVSDMRSCKERMNQVIKKVGKSRLALPIQICLMALWGTQLLNTDAYYVNYLLILIAASVCFLINAKSADLSISSNGDRFTDTVILVSAAAFSCMVGSANYRIWALTDLPEEFGTCFRWIYRIFLIVSIYVGGFFVFRNIFTVVFSNINGLKWKSDKEERTDPKKIFLISFTLLVLTRCILLYSCQYPGNLTPDSTMQISQTISGEYTNHHPFYHTMVIKCFMDLGMFLFHDINAAVATYSFFQILFMAMSFSFAVSTMARMEVPRWIIRITMVFFLFMPYHIIYAATMWKDVMFGCFILLLTIFTYRCMNGIGSRYLNYVMLALSGIGTCLFRSNGFFAFLLFTLAFVLIRKLSNRGVLIVLVAVLAVSSVMKYPVLANLGVSQPDISEYLSIPTQQIARVIYEGCELNEWEKSVLSEVIDLDKVPEKYANHISDPIKGLIVQKGNQQFIAANKGTFIKLYFSLGLKYPLVYLRAWIDQTRGYWNAGYEYWRWYNGVIDDSLGLKRTVNISFLDTALREYLWLFTGIQILRLFLSIGLFVWIDLLMFIISFLKKDPDGIIASLPILVVVLSLLVSTPVFSEFRYVYAAFCSLPMVIVIVMRPNGREKGKIHG